MIRMRIADYDLRLQHLFIQLYGLKSDEPKIVEAHQKRFLILSYLWSLTGYLFVLLRYKRWFR